MTSTPPLSPARSAGKLKTACVVGLVAVNAALGLSLLSRSSGGSGSPVDLFEAHAVAQAAGGRGDFIMIPGQIQGQQQQVVYILETTTGSLTAMGYDDSNRRLDFTVPPLRLSDAAGR